MASLEIKSFLAELESPATSQQARLAGYHNLLQDIVTRCQASELSQGLIAFISSILGDSLGIVTARPLLGACVEALRKVKSTNVQIEAGKYTLQALENRVVSFEEQDVALREIVADAYQREEDYEEAAKVLQGIQLESSQRKVTDAVKIGIWIRICRLYLEVDDTLNAEGYLNRAKNLLYKVEDKELHLHFQLSQARILDSRRKFVEASQAYHLVSHVTALAEEERNLVLSKAIICAVLAPAGPQRSRLLGKLYKDERALALEEFGILEKMFLDRLIAPDQVSKFAEKLAPHQLAQTADGSTVIAKAVIEHNLLATSKLYSNIGSPELGILLGLEPHRAENYAASMVEQGRLSGQIDQIEGLIRFEDADLQTGKANSISSGLRIWDKHIKGLVEDVERVSSLLQSSISEGCNGPCGLQGTYT